MVTRSIAARLAAASGPGGNRTSAGARPAPTCIMEVPSDEGRPPSACPDCEGRGAHCGGGGARRSVGPMQHDWGPRPSSPGGPGGRPVITYSDGRRDSSVHGRQPQAQLGPVRRLPHPSTFAVLRMTKAAVLEPSSRRPAASASASVSLGQRHNEGTPTTRTPGELAGSGLHILG
jgi:hypothetical protein